MFKTIMNRYATPFTTGLFLSSLISGAFLFFGQRSAGLNGMHEWLSMVLIVPFVFHVWKNFGPLMSYLKRGWLIWPLALSLVASLAFYAPTYLAPAGQAPSGGNPLIGLANTLAGAKLADLAPVMRKSPEDLTKALTGKGSTVASADATLNDIAKASGKTGREAVMALAASR